LIRKELVSTPSGESAGRGDRADRSVLILGHLLWLLSPSVDLDVLAQAPNSLKTP
jgi:hypothetical protein